MMATVSSSPTLTSFIRLGCEPERRRHQIDAPDRREIRAVGVLLEDAIENGIRCGNALVGPFGRAVLRHPFADHAQFFPPDGIEQQLGAQRQLAVWRQRAGGESPVSGSDARNAFISARPASFAIRRKRCSRSSHDEMSDPTDRSGSRFPRCADLQTGLPRRARHAHVQPVGEPAVQLARQRSGYANASMRTPTSPSDWVADSFGRDARRARTAEQQGECALHLFTSTEPIRYRSTTRMSACRRDIRLSGRLRRHGGHGPDRLAIPGLDVPAAAPHVVAGLDRPRVGDRELLFSEIEMRYSGVGSPPIFSVQ